MTGSSSSVRDPYEKLRNAGAVARETLKAAAAKRSGVPVTEIRTQPGAGRATPPGTFEDHVKDVTVWGAAGQPCPN